MTDQAPAGRLAAAPLILALILGAVAAALIVFYLGSRSADGDQQVIPTTEVVVASRDTLKSTNNLAFCGLGAPLMTPMEERRIAVPSLG